VKPLSVERQIARLRPHIGFAPHMHRWLLGAAAVGIIAAAVLRHPVPLMPAAFLALVGFAERRTGPNAAEAIRAYDTGVPTQGDVSVAITCWDTDDHYHATLHEQGHDDWKYEFIPVGWKPAAGSYPAKIWRNETDGRPLLAVTGEGVMMPRDDPEQLPASRI